MTNKLAALCFLATSGSWLYSSVSCLSSARQITSKRCHIER